MGSVGYGIVGVAGMVYHLARGESGPSRRRVGIVESEYEKGRVPTSPFVNFQALAVVALTSWSIVRYRMVRQTVDAG
jgi:hypothetical protein